MKINSIQSYYGSNSFGAEAINKSPDNNKVKEDKKIKTSTLIYGISALTAIGIATFGILKSGKSSVKNVSKAIQETKNVAESAKITKPVESVTSEVAGSISKKNVEELPIPDIEQELSKIASETPENIIMKDSVSNKESQQVVAKAQETVKNNSAASQEINSPQVIKSDNFTVKDVEIEPFSYQNVDHSIPPFEGVEKTLYVDYNNGTGRTYQRFYHKDKIYECSVYDEIFGDNPDSIIGVTRYNYAYENGKLVGVAKQTVETIDCHWGEYKNGIFEPFPILVKMKGEKDFKDVKVYTPDALFELDKRFDPYNL